jgi:hypothetical protein
MALPRQSDLKADIRGRTRRLLMLIGMPRKKDEHNELMVNLWSRWKREKSKRKRQRFPLVIPSASDVVEFDVW